jgi:nucleoside-diphosphate-sugar epimerase
MSRAPFGEGPVMPANVFIAGASGAIGRRLTPLLLEAGYTVFGLTRDPAKARELESSGVRAIVGDVYDAPALAAAVASARAEIVVHQLTDLPQSRADRGDPAALARNARVRVEGTQHLIDAALAAGARRMVAQSIAFAYAEGQLPHSETDPLDVETRGSVITLERLVLESPPLSGTVLRFGSLYGPGTWFDEPTGDLPVHVDAAAQATLLAIQRAVAGIFNVAEERGYLNAARARAVLGWTPGFRLKAT